MENEISEKDEKAVKDIIRTDIDEWWGIQVSQETWAASEDDRLNLLEEERKIKRIQVILMSADDEWDALMK